MLRLSTVRDIRADLVQIMEANVRKDILIKGITGYLTGLIKSLEGDLAE